MPRYHEAMSADRPKLVLRPDRCDGCGRCVDECRHNAIRVGVGYIYVDWSRCDGCGKCAAYCDREAILERGADSTPTGPAHPSGGLELGAGSEGQRWRWPKARLWRPKPGTPGVGAPTDLPAPAPGTPPDWSAREAALVVGVAVLLQVVMRVVLASESARSLTESGVMLVRGTALGVYYTLQVALLVALAARRRSRFAAAFRLDVPPDALSAPLGLAMLVGTWLFAMLYRAAAISAGWRPPAADSPSLESLFGSDAVGVSVTVLVVVVLGPFVEELLLRGVLLGALERRFARWPAIAVSSLVFAALHGSLWSFLPITVLGLALGRIASRRRSLWPAVILHVAYNAVIVAPAFLVVARG